MHLHISSQVSLSFTVSAYAQTRRVYTSRLLRDSDLELSPLFINDGCCGEHNTRTGGCDAWRGVSWHLRYSRPQLFSSRIQTPWEYRGVNDAWTRFTTSTIYDSATWKYVWSIACTLNDTSSGGECNGNGNCNCDRYNLPLSWCSCIMQCTHTHTHTQHKDRFVTCVL